MKKRALVFPGQGSQVIGMGKEIADNFVEARDVFREVDEALKQNLFKLMTEGTIEELTDTSNTQPALMAVSVAVVRVLEKQSGKKINELASYVAGHSLGEYSALCSVGSISLADTARLLKTRGRAMQEAVPKGKGGMVALIGADLSQAKIISEKASVAGICEVANDNGGGQIVLSGEIAAIDLVVNIAAENGVKRAVKLQVSAPFHSSLIKKAGEVMADALSQVTVNKPIVPLIANITADEVIDAEKIKELLVKQVTGMVRWNESIINLAKKDIGFIVECGAGKVLSGLVKRIDSSLQSVSLQVPKDIEEFIRTI